jgi:hypothetical protein
VNDIHPKGVYDSPIAGVYANHENEIEDAPEHEDEREDEHEHEHEDEIEDEHEHEDQNENEIEILNNKNINVNVIEILDDAQVNIDNQPEEMDGVHDQPELNNEIDGVNNAEDDIFNNCYGPCTENKTFDQGAHVITVTFTQRLRELL